MTVLLAARFFGTGTGGVAKRHGEATWEMSRAHAVDVVTNDVHSVAEN